MPSKCNNNLCRFSLCVLSVCRVLPINSALEASDIPANPPLI